MLVKGKSPAQLEAFLPAWAYFYHRLAMDNARYTPPDLVLTSTSFSFVARDQADWLLVISRTEVPISLRRCCIATDPCAKRQQLCWAWLRPGQAGGSPPT